MNNEATLLDKDIRISDINFNKAPIEKLLQEVKEQFKKFTIEQEKEFRICDDKLNKDKEKIF